MTTKTNSTQKFFKALIYISVFLGPFYFFRFLVLGFKTNIFEVFVLLAFIVLIINHLFSLTIKKFHFGSVWIYLFLLAALFGTFIADDKTHALGIFKGWFLFPVILFILIINTFKKENITKLSIPLYFSLLIVSVWAIMQKIGIIGQLFYQVGDGSFRQYFAEGRAFGPFESPNYLAMFLAPMIFLTLPIFKIYQTRLLKSSTTFCHSRLDPVSEVRDESRIDAGKSTSWIPDLKLAVWDDKRGMRWLLKALIAISFALPLLALYYTTSRGGAVALISSLIAFLIFLYIKSKVFRSAIERQSSILIFSLIIAVTVFLIYAIRIISPNLGGDSIRIEIYNYSISLVKNNPIFGIGLGEFQNKIAEISKNSPSFQQYGLSYALHPHNIFLAMWLNLGLAGLITFLGLIWIGFKKIFSRKDNIFFRACLFSALIAILVHGLFDTTYFKNDLSAIFWLIFAYVVVIDNEIKP